MNELELRLTVRDLLARLGALESRVALLEDQVVALSPDRTMRSELQPPTERMTRKVEDGPCGC